MSATDVSVLIGIATFIITIVTTAVIVGIAWGKTQARITEMSKDLAEIKGMFRLTLKE